MIQQVSEVYFRDLVPIVRGSQERRLVISKPALSPEIQIERMLYDTEQRLLTVLLRGELPRVYPAEAISMMVPAAPEPEAHKGKR